MIILIVWILGIWTTISLCCATLVFVLVSIARAVETRRECAHRGIAQAFARRRRHGR